MKFILLIILALSLTGCGQWDRFNSEITGNASKVCVDGVTYLQFTSGATIQLGLDGKPIACK